MGLFANNEIDALDKELDRLHALWRAAGNVEAADIYSRIKEIENTLLEIARKRNGLEY